MSSNINKTSERVLADDTDVRAATAPHQRDFPYDREEEAQVTRREFCNFLGLTSAALFIGATGFAGKARSTRAAHRLSLLQRSKAQKHSRPALRLTFTIPQRRTVRFSCDHSMAVTMRSGRSAHTFPAPSILIANISDLNVRATKAHSMRKQETCCMVHRRDHLML